MEKTKYAEPELEVVIVGRDVITDSVGDNDVDAGLG